MHDATKRVMAMIQNVIDHKPIQHVTRQTIADYINGKSDKFHSEKTVKRLLLLMNIQLSELKAVAREERVKEILIKYNGDITTSMISTILKKEGHNNNSTIVYRLVRKVRKETGLDSPRLALDTYKDELPGYVKEALDYITITKKEVVTNDKVAARIQSQQGIKLSVWQVKQVRIQMGEYTPCPIYLRNSHRRENDAERRARDWRESDKGWITKYNGKDLELIRGKSTGYGGYDWTATYDGETVKETDDDGRVFIADSTDDRRARSWKLCVLQYLEPEENS